MAATQSPLRGIGLKVTAVVVFIAMAACIKALQPALPPGEAVFARSFFALPVVIVWLWLRHDLANGLKTNKPMAHVWRGMIGSAAMLMGFGALGLLPLPQATAINYAMPVFTVILAVLFLGERIRLFRLSAVALGIAGVVIVAWPDLVDAPAGTVQFTGVLLALGGALMGGIAQVVIRRLVVTEDAAAIVFYFQLAATVGGLATLPLGFLELGDFLRPWAWPSPLQWALMIASGVLGGIGQILHTSAYRYADASVIAPFEYASMVFAIAIGYFAFAEVPTGTTLIGVTIVIVAGILIIWRESRLGISRTPSKMVKVPQ